MLEILVSLFSCFLGHLLTISDCLVWVQATLLPICIPAKAFPGRYQMTAQNLGTLPLGDTDWFWVTIFILVDFVLAPGMKLTDQRSLCTYSLCLYPFKKRDDTSYETNLFNLIMLQNKLVLFNKGKDRQTGTKNTCDEHSSWVFIINLVLTLYNFIILFNLMSFNSSLYFCYLGNHYKLNIKHIISFLHTHMYTKINEIIHK